MCGRAVRHVLFLIFIAILLKTPCRCGIINVYFIGILNATEVNMKRIISGVLAAAMAMSLISCGADEESEASKAQDITSAAEVKNNESDFGKYVSNTYIATGNNNIVEEAESVTYRAYFPVEEYGELEYCFYFSNTVDSTYDDGEEAYAGRVGGDYTIESAYIADGGTSIEDEITGYQAVTFDGAEQKSVSGGETYWSDPITFDVEEGHYLVWEWTLTGTDIPAISMSNLTKVGADYGDGNGLVYCDQVPMPQLIGASRDVKYNIAAIGDSITQGCQTEAMAYEFWSARISQKLGDDYAFWNCGLGWSRMSDASLDGDWLERAAEADVVIVAFGTNDIVSGEYGGDGGNTASEIDSYLRTVLDKLKEKNCSVIVFNTPPEDYREGMEAVRTEYNELLKSTCEEYGMFYFDFASLLSTEEDPATALYGGHPNGEAGDIVSDEFINQYAAFLDVE